MPVNDRQSIKVQCEPEGLEPEGLEPEGLEPEGLELQSARSTRWPARPIRCRVRTTFRKVVG